MAISIPFNLLSNCEKILLHSTFSKELINGDAIFSDETEGFRSPSEPTEKDAITINLRTYRGNVEGVYLVYDDKKISMALNYTEDVFDYYTIKVDPTSETKRYYFEVSKNGESYYYSKNGFSKQIDRKFDFIVLRNFITPDWAKGAVMYQIYVDRFYNGDKSNDVLDNEYQYLGGIAKRVEDWNQLPQTQDISNFYGGDLKGVIDKMDYLQSLGIDVIYFNPLFVSPSNHKYDIQDYDYIDPHYGVIVEDGGSVLEFEKFNNKHASMYIKRTTDKVNLEASNKLFCDLVEIAHSKGIKVILDGVFNHCGAYNKWLDKEGFYNASGNYPVGAYSSKDSIYHNYFKWFDMDNWPNNNSYDGWWGYDNHPKLNFEDSKELYDYILEIGAKWVSPPYNCDGWRLDVAADLGTSKEFNHEFWRDFRNSVKTANPEAIILAEHYGEAADWLQGDQWDTIMNYDAFMEPITWFLTGMEKHSESFNSDMLSNGNNFKGSMKWHMSRLSYQSLYTSMNELSNHDHSRFLTRTNMKVGRLHTVGSELANEGLNKAIFREAVVYQFTWHGCPTIYYGDEAGLAGWTDPDNRRSYPWGNEDNELIDLHRQMIKIRKDNDVLRLGSLLFLNVDYGVVAYGRFDKKEKIVVILNNNKFQKKVTVPVWRIGVLFNSKMTTLISTNKEGFSLENKDYEVKAGKLNIVVDSYGSVVLKF